MRNIAIIPARSGSKGLPDKNIKLLNGIPLLAYSIEAAKASGSFDEIMVSTDSVDYAGIAKQYGAAVPFLRSSEQSSDTASSWDAVREVLQRYLALGSRFDSVCLLQPTSPLRTADDIVRGYRLLEERDADAITSVCEVDHSPLWTMTLPDDGSLKQFRAGLQAVPRQALAGYYRLNGAIYIRRIRYDIPISLSEEREYALVMDRRHSVDIDTAEDFEYAEYLMRRVTGE